MVAAAGRRSSPACYPGLYEDRGKQARRPYRAREEWAADEHLDGGKTPRGVHQAERARLLQEFGTRRVHVSIGVPNPKARQRPQAGLCPACDKAATPRSMCMWDGGAHERYTDSGSTAAERTTHTSFTQCLRLRGPADGAEFRVAVRSGRTGQLQGHAHRGLQLTVFISGNDIMLDGPGVAV